MPSIARSNNNAAIEIARGRVTLNPITRDLPPRKYDVRPIGDKSSVNVPLDTSTQGSWTGAQHFATYRSSSVRWIAMNSEAHMSSLRPFYAN